MQKHKTMDKKMHPYHLFGPFRDFIFIFSIAMSAPAYAQGTDRNGGWIMFNDTVAAGLELREGQIDRLREIDRRYMSDYQRLGSDPSSDPNYVVLTEKRNAEVRTVLDDEQYRAWLQLNDDRALNDRNERIQPGPQSSEMDRRDPQGNQRVRDRRAVETESVTPKTGRTGRELDTRSTP